MKSTQEQIQELRGLKDGWLHGDGVAPTEAALAGVSRIIDADSVFRLYPMFNGGVSLEYSLRCRSNYPRQSYRRCGACRYLDILRFSE